VRRIKRIVLGIGFTFGLEALVSLLFIAVAYMAKLSEVGVPEDPILMAALGLALGAFLVGGFFLGWASPKIPAVDALVMASATLILTWAAHGTFKGRYFISGKWLAELIQYPWSGIAFIMLALMGAAVGSYLGWRASVPSERQFDRAVLLLGLIGSVVVPFLLLAIGGPDRSGLPWYFMVAVFIILLVTVGAGFWMFARESNRADEISISPERRRDWPKK
jgi:hypothetical protein